MKLEEVLPAMRAGRVGLWGGLMYRIHSTYMQVFDGRIWVNTENTASDMLDGWTLEPEPKVEWPKGSYQWAAEQVPVAAPFDKHMRRKSTGHYSFESAYDMLALDWEVVP